jgi:phenylacetate-CoA ligase
VTDRPFATREATYGIACVSDYIHPLDDRRVETVASQRRILRRWEADRESLRAALLQDPEDTQRRQLERVRALVDAAFATHPLYHRLYSAAGYSSGDLVTWADYDALPIVDKQMLIDAEDEIRDAVLLPDEALYFSTTSGSSGAKLTVIQDDATNDTGTLLYLRQFEQMLGRERRHDEWLYEVYLAPPRHTSLDGRYPAFTISQDAPPELVAAHIERLRPAVLWAFPSFLARLERVGADLRSLGVEVVCTHSETSSAGERLRHSTAFGVPVLDEYSSEELYLIASMCRAERYHLVEDNVRVDIVSAGDDGVGEVVATSLVATAMPFIRYRQGDLARVGPLGEECPCGNRHRQLRELQGRADQALVATDGRIVAPDRIMGLYDRTLVPADSGVEEFHVRQVKVGAVEVLARVRVGGEEAATRALDAFEQGLRDLLADPATTVSTVVVGEIPAGLSHKRRLVTSALIGQGTTPCR